MDELIAHLPLWLKIVISFTAGNALWFFRQRWWEQRVGRRHERLLREILRLREQVGHFALAMSQQITLTESERREVQRIFDDAVG